MNIQIYIPLTLSQVQTILALILSVLGFGWFFFLSSTIRYHASKRIQQSKSVPVIDTIVPLNMVDIFNLLLIKRTSSTIIICLLVLLGLAFTNFDSIIVVNTITYTESCRTDIVTTPAQITTDNFQVAVAAYAETSAMLQKRSKSGIPSGVIVGQYPIDSRWIFDASLDVDPYPWRSSCSISILGTTNVNLNTSILFDSVYQTSNLDNLLPEVNAEYKFHNSPDGFNYTRRFFRTYTHFNRSSSDAINSTATGSLTLLIEEFTKGNVSDVGTSVIHRLWTLRVPEEDRLPYQQSNSSITSVILVPIDVKAYDCNATRVKEGSRGSVNILGDLSVAIDVAGDLIGRKYLTAQIKGTDYTIFEYSPEYWASYMASRDTMTISNFTNVEARMYLPCITIHPLYVLLLCTYSIFIIIGFIFWRKLYRKIPSSVVGWVVHACKESNLPDISDAEFRDHTDIRIFQKELENSQNNNNNNNIPVQPMPYDSNIKNKDDDEDASSQRYYSQIALGSEYPNKLNA